VARCKIILNKMAEWEAPEWVARTLVAYLDTWFWQAESKIEGRFEKLLNGQATNVDLSRASASEIRQLLQVLRSARRSIKPPAKWHKPASALEFIGAYDELVKLLNLDRRVSTD
jgi:hypothetical protein